MRDILAGGKKRCAALLLCLFLACCLTAFSGSSLAFAEEGEDADSSSLAALSAIEITTSPATATITPSVRQDRTFRVTVSGSTKGWTATLSGNRSADTELVVSSSNFKVIVDTMEPSGTLYVTVTSKEDSSVTLVVPIVVKSKPLLTDIQLQYNESAFVVSPYTTGRRVSEAIQMYATALCGNYYVDFSNNYHFSHLCYWSDMGFVSLEDSDDPLVAGRQYYLQLNVEEDEAFWPTDLAEISVTVNGTNINDIPGAGLLWYAQTSTGSLNVYIPLTWTDEQTVDLRNYGTLCYTAAQNVLVYLRTDFQEDTLSVPLFRNQVMYYVPDYEAWCAVVDPDSQMVSPFDFALAFVSSAQEKATYVVAKPEYAGYGLVGDVNLNGMLTVVDAQIAYDAATGAYRVASDLPGRSWLIADVNHDQYVDSTDALCIQYALFFGWD